MLFLVLGRKKIPAAFLASFVLFFGISIHAEHLPVKTYTIADGLLRDAVYKIRQDSRGFLWFCTVEGLSRFDGYTFTNLTSNDGLPDRHVNDLLETTEGTIYVATDAGVARLNPKGLPGSKDEPLFSAIVPSDPKAKECDVLFEGENGSVWAGTNGGLYRLNAQGQLDLVELGGTSGEMPAVSSIIKDRHGAMWIGTKNMGLFRLRPDGAVDQFNEKNGLPGINIGALLEDKNGRIWVGLRPGLTAGLLKLVADPGDTQNIVERRFSETDGLPAEWITDLYQDDDSFWVATTRGLCKWQGENSGSVCKTYTSKNDLCDQDVWTITKDKDGNLWTGTRCGVKKWKRYGFMSYTETDGTGYPIVNSIFENRPNELFASFNTGLTRTVSRFDGEKFELVKPNFPHDLKYFGWGWKQTVLQDSTGDWWVPTGSGLFRFRHCEKFEDLAGAIPEKIESGAPSAEVFRVFEDSRNDIWIGTVGATGQLLKWDRAANTWHDYTSDLGLPLSQFVTSFVEDHQGNLWIGTGSDIGDAALIRYSGGQFKVFTRQDGIPEGWIRDAFIDHAGRLWLANTTAGLLRFDDLTSSRLDPVTYTPKEGLSSIAVSCITEDEFGRIYVGGGRGLDRLDPASGQVENFTTADGLPNSNIEVAYRDRSNDLWFGTSNGLARFKPEPEHARIAPNVLVTGLRVNGEPKSVSILGESSVPLLELASDQKQISVDFLGLAASLGEKLKYEYRLGRSEWTPTTERTVNFANLNPGEYNFETRAFTSDGIYGRAAVVSFRIATPLWQRWWFVSAVLLLTAFAVYLFYKNRLMRLLQMERMRTRIATDLHDDVGANLTRIALLSEVANQKGANGRVSDLLPSIADIARESVASMNDIVWAIAPEHDSLLDLTRRMRQHAEEIFSLREIDLEFNAPSADVDLKLSVGVRRDVLLIFKEAVNNAAKHSGCSRIQIDFNCENSLLGLRIKDSGKGFDPDDHKSDGQGLRSMLRRAKALGGDLRIQSTAEGTLIEFEMSLPKTPFLSRL